MRSNISIAGLRFSLTDVASEKIHIPLTSSESAHGKLTPMEVLIACIRRRASCHKSQVERVSHLVIYSVQDGVLLLQRFAHGLPNALQRPNTLFNVIQSLILLGLCQLPVLQQS